MHISCIYHAYWLTNWLMLIIFSQERSNEKDTIDGKCINRIRHKIWFDVSREETTSQSLFSRRIIVDVDVVKRYRLPMSLSLSAVSNNINHRLQRHWLSDWQTTQLTWRQMQEPNRERRQWWKTSWWEEALLLSNSNVRKMWICHDFPTVWEGSYEKIK